MYVCEGVFWWHAAAGLLVICLLQWRQQGMRSPAGMLIRGISHKILCDRGQEKMVWMWGGVTDLSVCKNDEGRRRKQEDDGDVDLFILPCLV